MGRNETSNFRLLFMMSATLAFVLFTLVNSVSRPCYSCELSILALSEDVGDPVLTETSLLFNCESKTKK